MRRLTCYILVVSLLFLAGCATKFNPVVEGTSFAFIHIDLTDERTVPTWAKLKQMFPKTDKPYWSMGVVRDKDNKYAATFFLANLKPGTYQMSGFGGKSRRMFENIMKEFEFPGVGKGETAIKADKSDFYFMGSYKVLRTNSKWADYINRGKFKIEKVSAPSRAEVLKGLLPRLHRFRSGWEDRVKLQLGIVDKK